MRNQQFQRADERIFIVPVQITQYVRVRASSPDSAANKAVAAVRYVAVEYGGGIGFGIGFMAIGKVVEAA